MSPTPSSKRAYAHLLTNASYLAGLLVLHQSHLRVNSRYDFVVMVTPSVNEQVRTILRDVGMIVRPVDTLRPHQKIRLDKGDARFSDTWTKLRAFELFEYQRVVLRDIDMLLLHNVDDLFDIDLPPDFIAATHVCACNPRRFSHYPSDWIPENCAYTPLSYPSCLSHATPITPHSPRPHTLLNSGVVLLTPSKETVSKIKSLLTKPIVQTYKFPDQDFLAELFRDRWRSLPWVYNALKSLRLAHPNIWRDEDARCVHYIMAEKPWMVSRPDTFPSRGRQMTSIVNNIRPKASFTSSTSFHSFTSTEDTLSTSSDCASTRAASPAASQLDIRLEDAPDDSHSLIDLDALQNQRERMASSKVLSWMGENEEELLRWWWTAFDDLEAEMATKPWWPVVEVNVEEKRSRGTFTLA